MSDTQKWLAEYAQNGSESAFRHLVAAHLDLVYCTALRLVDGDRHFAEDVAQKVFLDLATQARSLSRDAALGGWLHRHTCFVAANALRAERRRQSRERQAAEMSTLEDHSQTRLSELAPVLDEAVNQLDEKDRTAILLRFYERQDFRAIGEAFGASDDAVQKRVSRALEKLRLALIQRGVTLTVSALGVALAGEIGTAAPVGLAAKIATTALAGAAAGTQALTLMKIATMFKAKIAFAGLAAVVAMGVPMTMQYQELTKLRRENQSLRVPQDQLAQLRANNLRLSNAVFQAAKDREKQIDELAKLRGQVVSLNTDKARNDKLQAQLTAALQRGNVPDASANPQQHQMAYSLTQHCLENIKRRLGSERALNVDMVLEYFNQQGLKLQQSSSVEFKRLANPEHPERMAVLLVRATLQELEKVENLIQKADAGGTGE